MVYFKQSTFIWLAAALLTGCASVTQLPPPDTSTSGNYQALTTPIITLGDTQEHLSTGFPLHDNDSAIDAYVEVAQRPPEQALFGRRLMEWVLHNHAQEPFLHLGDVMDLSCRIEADRMNKIFQAALQAGAILPGNHDGLMFGIYAYGILSKNGANKIMPEVDHWNKACMRGTGLNDNRYKTNNEAISKRDFIALYIAQHSKDSRVIPPLEKPHANGKQSISWRSSDPHAFLSGIAAELVDGQLYADSYIAQRLKLPRATGATRDTIIIGLDTNQSGLAVDAMDTLLGHSPGDLGKIHPDQIFAITQWVDEAKARGDIVIFAGHHNWLSLNLASRSLLFNLMSQLDHPLVYLSAHTHTGFWATHNNVTGRPVLELNTSSLSDWPLAYRRVSFAYDEANNRIQVKGDLMPRGVTPTLTDADLLLAWESQTCSKSASVRMKNIQLEDKTLVKLQRDSRGSLFEWMVSWLTPVCPECEAPLYQHALSYQREMLIALLQVGYDLGIQTQQLNLIKLPEFCKAQSLEDCAKSLLIEKPTNFKSSTDLFRRTASLVATLNDHLDDLSSPDAKNYMTCRAVQAAKIDYDLIDNEATQHRNEKQRRKNSFFVIEASVGMN
ncbi:MAG TPA: hypothetical protein PKC80_07220 [Burkholderiaceae bacterium]|nr:hypothetical protein [Burkholderiaceae bacterium]